MPDIFLSYDGAEEYWRVRFDDVFGRAFACNMVRPAQIQAETGQSYIDDLAAKGFLTPETVMVVLLGPKTYSSRKVDWEIAAALNKIGSRPAGLVAMRLPNHQDHGKSSVNPSRIPSRIADNLKSGYIKLYDWTESQRELENRLFSALKDARQRAHLIKNSRALMERDMFR